MDDDDVADVEDNMVNMDAEDLADCTPFRVEWRGTGYNSSTNGYAFTKTHMPPSRGSGLLGLYLITIHTCPATPLLLFGCCFCNLLLLE